MTNEIIVPEFLLAKTIVDEAQKLSSNPNYQIPVLVEMGEEEMEYPELSEEEYAKLDEQDLVKIVEVRRIDVMAEIKESGATVRDLYTWAEDINNGDGYFPLVTHVEDKEYYAGARASYLSKQGF